MSAARQPRAFTLIELLVAMVVLAIMLVLLSQMVSLASRIWTAGKAQADNFSQARVVLGLMDRDIRSMVLRRDLASFVDATGNPACAFYTRMPGPGQDRKLSLVAYQMAAAAKPVLLRFDQGFSYDSPSPPLSPTYGVVTALTDLSGAASQTLVEGVVRFEIQFVAADGTLGSSFQFDHDNPSAAANTRSVLLSLLILDSASLQLAQSSGKVPDILSAFGGAPPANQSYGKYWNGLLESGTGLSALPESARRGLKAFERHVVLPVAVAQ